METSSRVISAGYSRIDGGVEWARKSLPLVDSTARRVSENWPKRLTIARSPSAVSCATVNSSESEVAPRLATESTGGSCDVTTDTTSLGEAHIRKEETLENPDRSDATPSTPEKRQGQSMVFQSRSSSETWGSWICEAPLRSSKGAILHFLPWLDVLPRVWTPDFVMQRASEAFATVSRVLGKISANPGVEPWHVALLVAMASLGVLSVVALLAIQAFLMVMGVLAVVAVFCGMVTLIAITLLAICVGSGGNLSKQIQSLASSLASGGRGTEKQ